MYKDPHQLIEGMAISCFANDVHLAYIYILSLIHIYELITHYPVKRAASLMVLHAIQEKFGWISREAVLWTAKKLELQPINIQEILTFYPMLRQEPMGKYQIKRCV